MDKTIRSGGGRPPILMSRNEVLRMRGLESTQFPPRSKTAAGVEAIADCRVCWEESYIIPTENCNFIMASSFALSY